MPFIEKNFPIEEINELAIREVNARKPIYLIHKWFARRPGPTFRAIILATFLDEDPMKLYYQRVNLKEKLGYTPVIFDPFMGGGTTVIEALRLGAKVVGVDVNPLGWFITKKEVEPVDPKAFKEQVNRIEKVVAKRIKRYYKTLCPKKHLADIMYVFWVRVIKCENCKKDIPLFNNFTIARKKDGAHVFCPRCRYVFKTESDNIRVKCPECGYNFLPSEGWVQRGTYKCPNCTYTGEVLEAVRKEGKLPALEMYLLEYYCPKCGMQKRGYKRVNNYDKELFNEAKREFKKGRDGLLGKLIPHQEIPDGLKTRELKNYLFDYWHQLFNERQLLCLSLILEEILKIDDKNVRELVLLTFSDSVNANNMLCKYQAHRQCPAPLFGHHAFWFPQTPIEINVWGATVGGGSFTKYCKKALRALEYAKKPYEFRIKEKREKVEIPNERIDGKITQNFTELRDDEMNVMLLSTTSENLKGFIPNESVDAVITDPPYYDNVMYTELSDFFYVWLRLGLRNDYPMEFGNPLIDKRREIVVNEAVGKGAEFYINAMKRCLAEIHRTLKKEGVLVMTFHHSDPKAWAAVLKALVETGFTVRGAYPIHSETRSGVHPGIRYDSIITCRKVEESQLPSRPLPKAMFEAEIRNRVDADADRFVTGHPRLSIEDLYVAVMGRALQVLSENYAIMLRSGKVLSIEYVRKTLEDLGDIAFDVLLKKFFVKTPDVDRVSKIYASIFAGKRYISLDTIDKVTKHGGINFEGFEEDRGLEKLQEVKWSDTLIRKFNGEVRKRVLPYFDTLNSEESGVKSE